MSINIKAVGAAAEAIKPQLVEAGLTDLDTEYYAWNAALVGLGAAVPYLSDAVKRQGAIEALETAADELAMEDWQHVAMVDPHQWLRNRAAHLREE